MNEESKGIATIEELMGSAPEAVQPRLSEIREIIMDVASQLQEKNSWQMPTF